MSPAASNSTAGELCLDQPAPAAAVFNDAWRRQKSAAFDLLSNSTARRVVEFSLGGKPVRAYANANLSIYSGQTCNARCRFCVEELRPASRGGALSEQRSSEPDDARYFERLAQTLESLRPLNPTASVTGGEPSLDPRLPRILRLLAQWDMRRRTMTTNGSGLFDVRQGKRVLDWVIDSGVRHLNISRAHPLSDRNNQLMRFDGSLAPERLTEVAACSRAAGARARLSCVLLKGAVDDLEGVLRYLDFAASVGVDNVIFRQLMQPDLATAAHQPVVQYSASRRAALEPLLDRISQDGRFQFVRQIVGYYYYVEVWRYGDLDVVFEEANLAQLEAARRADPGLIHELVFHPQGHLASTWQPWDGVLD